MPKNPYPRFNSCCDLQRDLHWLTKIDTCVVGSKHNLIEGEIYV